MTTITDVTAKVSADIPAITIVTAQVHDAAPVKLNLAELAISPRSIRVGYWNDGTGIASAVVYGPEITNGRITPLLKKSVYGPDSLSSAPEWAQEFVAEQSLMVATG